MKLTILVVRGNFVNFIKLWFTAQKAEMPFSKILFLGHFLLRTRVICVLGLILVTIWFETVDKSKEKPGIHENDGLEIERLIFYSSFSVRQVLEAMDKDSGILIRSLQVDGGMTKNDLLMQLQADLAGIPVSKFKSD